MKKKMLVILLAAACSISMFGCGTSKSTESKDAASEETASETTGGWQMNTDETTAPLSDDVQKIFDQANEAYKDADFTPVTHMATQVVSGQNHMFLCKTDKESDGYKAVVIYADLDGNSEITKVTDFPYTDYVNVDIDAEAEENLAGGWTVDLDQQTVNLPADAQKAFDQAVGNLTGAGYEPLALLGSQLVSGNNYAILCRKTLVTAEPTASLAVLTIYAPLSGDASLTSVATINVADFT